MTAGPAGPEFSRGDLIDDRYWVEHYCPGGVNDVYLCIQFAGLDRVAVKIPKPRATDKTGETERRIFADEVRNWAELPEHPNVVNCLYASSYEHRWFLVLEWVGAPEIGRDLNDFVESLRDMEPGERLREIIRLASEICDGLAHIHAHGIVHGDLKPSNVLIDQEGRAKITDLGTGSKSVSAKKPRFLGRRKPSARDSLPAGTPGYMAPELWQHSSATVQTDIYALGCLLHELVTGTLPSETGNAAKTAALPDGLMQLITDCLRKDPSRRPASAELVAERLHRALGGPAEVPPPPTPEEPDSHRASDEPQVRPHRRMTLLSAAGRNRDALEQSDIAIKAAMTGLLMAAERYSAGDKPGSHLALLFIDRGALTGFTGNWAKAAADFITAIHLDPELAAAYANLGITYEMLDSPTLAIVAYNRAVELDPDDHRLYLKRARFLADYGWIGSAHEDYERAVALAPDDSVACYGMADSLFALGRAEEGSRYRAKAFDLAKGGGSGRSDEGLEYLRPADMRRGSNDALSEMIRANFRAQDNDHDAAIAGYSAAIKADPSAMHAYFERAESRLAVGDAAGALSDLDYFLENASTTHHYVPDALAARLRALEAIGAAGDPDGEADPVPKSASYIARKVQSKRRTENLVNWLPLEPSQRLALLDMLYGGDAGRKLTASRLLWNAFDEETQQRRTRYERLLPDLAGNDFSNCEIAGELAASNGLGFPVLLTEVRLSPNPLRDVRFSNSESPRLGWASAGAVGIWAVVPGTETDHVLFDGPVQAPLFSGDDSSYLLLGEHDIVLRSRDGRLDLARWTLEGESILSACYHDIDRLAVGLTPGSVMFPDSEPEAGGHEYLTLTSEQADTLCLWQSGPGAVTAFCGGVFYQVIPPGTSSAQPRLRELPASVPHERARLMVGSGPWAVWALPPDELLLTTPGQPGQDIRLASPNSANGEFTAAGVSLDGTVVAATCGSFLHVWQRPDTEADFAYLPMTPQPSPRSIAVSADGVYVAVGTTAGSVLVYRTRVSSHHFSISASSRLT